MKDFNVVDKRAHEKMLQRLAEKESAFEMLTLLHLQDEMRNETERVSPDTIGCDAFFVRYFVNESMEEDFGVIANAFYKNVPESMDFHNYDYYTDTSIRNTYLKEAFTKFTLSQILSFAKKGNEYAVQLLKYLYKTYYKSEYKVLKRFSRIAVTDIMLLSKAADDDIVEFAPTARIMTIAPFFGIQLDKDCSILYLLIERRNKKIEKDENSVYQSRIGIPEDKKEAIEAQLSGLLGTSNGSEELEAIESYWRYEEFWESIFEHMGYCEGVGSMQGGRMYVHDILLNTLYLLKKKYPKKDITKEDLMCHAVLYFTADVLADSMSSAEDYVSTMLGEIDIVNLRGSMFDKDEFERSMGLDKKRGEQNRKAVPEKKTDTVSRPVDARYEEQALLDEITELRAKLHKAESSTKHFAEQYAEIKKKSERLAEELDRSKTEHEELIALREHVYKGTEEDIVLEETTRQDYIEQLKDRKVVIIGGYSNWVQKMKECFPKWTYVSPKSTTTVNDTILEHVEQVFFFTDALKHHVYYRFINLVREKKIPFGYISSSNIDKCLKQMAEEMTKRK